MAVKHFVTALAALAGTAMVAAATTVTTLAPMPAPRSDHSCDVYNSAVYITGGCKSDQVYYDGEGNSACATFSKRLDRYDVASNTWTNLADMPRERYRHTSAVINGKLFLFGGILGGTAEVATPEVDVYDIATNQWHQAVELFTQTTTDLDCAVVRTDAGKSVVVLAGGYDISSNYASVNWTHLFDPETETFTYNVTTMNHDRGDLCLITIDNKVYASGGYNDRSFCVPLDDLEAYDVTANAWTDLDPNPEAGVDPVGDLTCAAHGKTLYNLGGEQKNAFCNGSMPVSHVDAYNTVAGTWTDSPFELTSARFRFCAATVNDAILIFGGQGPLEHLEAGDGHRLLNSVQRYDVLDSSPAAPVVSGSALAVLAAMATLAVVVLA